MLKNVVEKIQGQLVENGVENVYTCFDNIPIPSKGKGIFTVVGVEGMETSAPIFSQYTLFLPFKADVGISVIAPENMSMAQLYLYADDNIIPLISDIASLSCSLKNVVMKSDSNIRKLVLKIRFSVSGIRQIQRRDQTNEQSY